MNNAKLLYIQEEFRRENSENNLSNSYMTFLRDCKIEAFFLGPFKMFKCYFLFNS